MQIKRKKAILISKKRERTIRTPIAHKDQDRINKLKATQTLSKTINQIRAKTGNVKVEIEIDRTLLNPIVTTPIESNRKSLTSQIQMLKIRRQVLALLQEVQNHQEITKQMAETPLKETRNQEMHLKKQILMVLQ